MPITPQGTRIRVQPFCAFHGTTLAHPTHGIYLNKSGLTYGEIMNKFFTALSLLLLCAFATGAQAKVAWGTDTRGSLYCFPADSKGHVLHNSQSVDSHFCYLEFGVEWSVSTRNLMICVPIMPNYPDASRNAINQNYCYEKYRGEWQRGRDGYTHCYANYPGFSTGTRYAIDDRYCAL
jgi:hypothetical protein